MGEHLPQALDTECEPVRQFLRGFRAEATKTLYSKKLAQFLEACGMTADELLEAAKQDPRRVQQLVMDDIERRKDKVSGSTINQTVSTLKHFFMMNDAEDAISWKKITKTMPRARKVGSDRAPTIQEIRQMIDAADTRTRCIILVCATSGIRVGAFDEMSWRDIKPMQAGSDSGAARLTVYRGSPEEYVTFVTPECYETLLKYKAMREKAGEVMTDASPVIRNAWDTHPHRKIRRKDPSKATPLASKTISNMMGRFLKRINMRNRQNADAAGHEFKQIHGFRKFFKTNAERTMKTIDVEKLMGHAENYYKPPEEYLLEQYVAAVPDLTISEVVKLQNEAKTRDMIHRKNMFEYEGRTAALNKRFAELEDSVRNIRDKINPPKTVD